MLTWQKIACLVSMARHPAPRLGDAFAGTLGMSQYSASPVDRAAKAPELPPARTPHHPLRPLRETRVHWMATTAKGGEKKKKKEEVEEVNDKKKKKKAKKKSYLPAQSAPMACSVELGGTAGPRARLTAASSAHTSPRGSK